MGRYLERLFYYKIVVYYLDGKKQTISKYKTLKEAVDNGRKITRDYKNYSIAVYIDCINCRRVYLYENKKEMKRLENINQKENKSKRKKDFGFGFSMFQGEPSENRYTSMGLMDIESRRKTSNSWRIDPPKLKPTIKNDFRSDILGKKSSRDFGFGGVSFGGYGKKKRRDGW